MRALAEITTTRRSSGLTNLTTIGDSCSLPDYEKQFADLVCHPHPKKISCRCEKECNVSELVQTVPA